MMEKCFWNYIEGKKIQISYPQLLKKEKNGIKRKLTDPCRESGFLWLREHTWPPCTATKSMQVKSCKCWQPALFSRRRECSSWNSSPPQTFIFAPRRKCLSSVQSLCNKHQVPGIITRHGGYQTNKFRPCPGGVWLLTPHLLPPTTIWSGFCSRLLLNKFTIDHLTAKPTGHHSSPITWPF